MNRAIRRGRARERGHGDPCPLYSLLLALGFALSLGCATAPRAPAPVVQAISVAPAPLLGSSTRLLAVCSTNPGAPDFLECASFLVAVLDLQVAAKNVCFPPGTSLASVVEAALEGLRARPGDEEAAQIVAAAFASRWPRQAEPTPITNRILAAPAALTRGLAP